MGTQAKGTFEARSWNEELYGEAGDGPRVARASVANAFRGDVEGEGKLEYLMCYRDDGTGSFVGLEQVVGRVGDRSGGFALRHEGTFASDGTVEGAWTVVTGSGTGELDGLRGGGGFIARPGQKQTPFTLDCFFRDRP